MDLCGSWQISANLDQILIKSRPISTQIWANLTSWKISANLNRFRQISISLIWADPSWILQTSANSDQISAYLDKTRPNATHCVRWDLPVSNLGEDLCQKIRKCFHKGQVLKSEPTETAETKHLRLNLVSDVSAVSAVSAGLPDIWKKIVPMSWVTLLSRHLGYKEKVMYIVKLNNWKACWFIYNLINFI